MDNVRTVLASIAQVFVLVGFGWIYARRLRPELGGLLQLSMHLFVPALAFSSILDTRLPASLLGVAAAGTAIQITSGLLLGWVGLLVCRLGAKRELLLPISFVNAANLAFPLVLANFGQDGLSLGVVCYIVMSVMVYTVGVLVLHGGGRVSQAIREPALWGALLAVLLRVVRLELPEAALAPVRLAAQAAVPAMLVLFGESLSRASMTRLAPGAAAAVLRYLTGAIGLFVTLRLLHPDGLARKILIFYALLPAAMVNVLLAQKAGRDAETVASAVLLTTLAGLVVLPLLLAWLT